MIYEEKTALLRKGLFDSNEFNIGRALFYLQALGLRWGIAANSGKQVAEITGLRVP